MPSLDDMLGFEKMGKIPKSDFKLRGNSAFLERYQLTLGLSFALIRQGKDRTISSIRYNSLPKRVKDIPIGGFRLQSLSPGYSQYSKEIADESSRIRYHLLYGVGFETQPDNSISLSRFSIDASVSGKDYFFNASIQRTIDRKRRFERKAVMSLTSRRGEDKQTYAWNYTPQGRLVSSFGPKHKDIPDYVLRTLVGVSVPLKNQYGVICRSIDDARSRGADPSVILAMTTAMVYTFGHFDYGKKTKMLVDSFGHGRGNKIGQALRFFGLHLPNQ